MVSYRSYMYVCVLILLMAIAACGSSGVRQKMDPEPVINEPISLHNVAPVARIKSSHYIASVGNTVTLDASSSYDADQETGLQFQWTQVGGASVELRHVDEGRVSFTVVDSLDPIKIEIIVIDDKLEQSRAMVVQIIVQGRQGGVLPSTDDSDGNNYVFVDSQSGQDNSRQDGSVDQPFKTIQAGINFAKNQGVKFVLLAPGQYRESIEIPSNIHMIAGVVDVDDDVLIMESNIDPIGSRIISPLGSAIVVKNAENSIIEGLQIVGGSANAVSIHDSDSITLINNQLLTVGQAQNDCIDLMLRDSANIYVLQNSFANSSACKTYTAIDARTIENLTIDTQESDASIQLYPGNETSVRGIVAKQISSLHIANMQIESEASEALKVGTNAAALVIGDGSEIDIRNNQIDISGGKTVTGISLGCITAQVMSNDIAIQSASESQWGIQSRCLSIDDGAKDAGSGGIEKKLQLLKNNIILASDIASTGIGLSPSGVMLNVIIDGGGIVLQDVNQSGVLIAVTGNDTKLSVQNTTLSGVNAFNISVLSFDSLSHITNQVIVFSNNTILSGDDMVFVVNNMMVLDSNNILPLGYANSCELKSSNKRLGSNGLDHNALLFPECGSKNLFQNNHIE